MKSLCDICQLEEVSKEGWVCAECRKEVKKTPYIGKEYKRRNIEV